MLPKSSLFTPIISLFIRRTIINFNNCILIVDFQIPSLVLSSAHSVMRSLRLIVSIFNNFNYDCFALRVDVRRVHLIQALGILDGVLHKCTRMWIGSWIHLICTIWPAVCREYHSLAAMVSLIFLRRWDGFFIRPTLLSIVIRLFLSCQLCLGVTQPYIWLILLLL